MKVHPAEASAPKFLQIEKVLEELRAVLSEDRLGMELDAVQS